MPRFEFQLVVVSQTLECGAVLAEALFWPEFLRYSNFVERSQDSLARSIVNAMPGEDRDGLWRRRAIGMPDVGEKRIRIDPPRKDPKWRAPVDLTFQTVEWTQGADARIVYIPALGIEVIGRPADDLSDSVESNIRLALRLIKATTLGKLVWAARVRSVGVACQTVDVTLKTSKQVASDATREDDDRKKSVLKQIGSNLSKRAFEESFEIGALVERIAGAITGENPHSVLLTGPSGVGKTAAVYETVRRRKELGLTETAFWETSGSRLVAGMSGFGMWQQRCQQLWLEASKRGAVLYLGNLVELMEVGKSAGNNQGIAAFLRPYIARGSLLAIVECTPEQIPVIEREDPRLLDAFMRIDVEEPSVDRGRAILMNVALAMQSGEVLDYEALDALDRLHRRYATYSAYPGRPVRFLRNMLRDRAQGEHITANRVTQVFARETGLPRFLLDDMVPLHLNEAREWFSGRVIGQPDAVDLVVNLLATVKAGLSRPLRPIASLLFIGPTGVGKTEMAKSLAEFLFKSRDRMVRLDMSEYADPLAVERLIGGAFGTEGVLTGKVREQPFSVVLFDEVEKAHPSFFDLLLQVLGEGRLTDGAGRLADFRNSVIIMTSNLGAESYRAGMAGFREKPAADAARHFTSQVRAYLRPELFNRIDRIVAFAPLDEDTVYEIARRELARLRDRDGVRYRKLELSVSNEVVGHLAVAGYDARYGARPLKRAVERELLVPLAEALNLYSGDIALLADVRVDGHRLSVDVKPKLDESGRPAAANVADPSLVDLSRRAAEFRRSAQKLEGCAAGRELKNWVFRLAQTEKRFKHKVWTQEHLRDRIRKLPEMRRVSEGIGAVLELADAIEDDVVMALFGRVALDRETAEKRLAAGRDEWTSLVTRLHCLQFERPDFVTVAVYGEQPGVMFDLARGYHGIAKESGLEVARIVQREQTGPAGETVECLPVQHPADFLEAAPRGVFGIVLSISARMAFPRFSPERGVHQFKIGEQTVGCLVQTAEAPISEYKPIQGLERRGVLSTYIANMHEVRRVYDVKAEEFQDFGLDRQRFYWNGRAFVDALGPAMEEKLWRNAQAMLE